MKQIALVLFIGLALSLCNLSERLHGSKSGSNSSGGSVSDNGASPERGTPTAAQTAALSGGSEAKWARQGMSWTAPPNWTEEQNESQSFMLRSPGGGGAASLIVSISPMAEEFPIEESLKATFEGAKTRAKNGEVDELKWVEIDGVKGVQFREANPDNPTNSRRLQWIAYRKYTGQVQYVNVMLASDARDFDRHKDAMYGILYSMKLAH